MTKSTLLKVKAILLLVFIAMFAIGCADQAVKYSGGKEKNNINNSAKDITNFKFRSALNSGNGITYDCTGIINGTNIAITVPYGTIVNNLIATFTTTGKSVMIDDIEQISGITINDYSSSKIYKVTAMDNSMKEYKITVSVALNTSKDITNFKFTSDLNLNSGINSDCIGTISWPDIKVTVPYGTNVSKLIATFTTTGQSVKIEDVEQISEVTNNNFTNPIKYKVTAANGLIKEYSVKVTIALNTAKSITGFKFTSALNLGAGITYDCAGIIIQPLPNNTTGYINVSVPIGTDITNLIATYITTGASVKIGSTSQESDVTVNNFTNKIKYTITAEDGSIKYYEVCLNGYISGCAIGWIGGEKDGWYATDAPLGAFYTKNSYKYIDGAGQVYVDTAGNIYITEYENNRVSKWDKNGNAIGWIGGGTDGWKTENGPSNGGDDYKSFYSPHGICVDTEGNIYISQIGMNRISKWDKNGNAIGWIGGGTDGWKTSTGPNDSGKDYKSFYNPYGICIDSDGNIYATDMFNYRISKWDKNGNAIGWIGGGTDGWKTSNAPYSGGDGYKYFDGPNAVWVDSLGNIYVSELSNNRVSKWDKNGNAIGWIGGGTDGWKTSDAPPIGYDYKEFFDPEGISVDTAGNIYVVECENNRVSKWSSNGNAIGWIGNGVNGWQTATNSSPLPIGSKYNSFWNPCGIFIDADDYLYIADTKNHRISKWK